MGAGVSLHRHHVVRDVGGAWRRVLGEVGHAPGLVEQGVLRAVLLERHGQVVEGPLLDQAHRREDRLRRLEIERPQLVVRPPSPPVVDLWRLHDRASVLVIIVTRITRTPSRGCPGTTSANTRPCTGPAPCPERSRQRASSVYSRIVASAKSSGLAPAAARSIPPSHESPSATNAGGHDREPAGGRLVDLEGNPGAEAGRRDEDPARGVERLQVLHEPQDPGRLRGERADPRRSFTPATRRRNPASRSRILGNTCSTNHTTELALGQDSSGIAPTNRRSWRSANDVGAGRTAMECPSTSVRLTPCAASTTARARRR